MKFTTATLKAAHKIAKFLYTNNAANTYAKCLSLGFKKLYAKMTERKEETKRNNLFTANKLANMTSNFDINAYVVKNVNRVVNGVNFAANCAISVIEDAKKTIKKFIDKAAADYKAIKEAIERNPNYSLDCFGV